MENQFQRKKLFINELLKLEAAIWLKLQQEKNTSKEYKELHISLKEGILITRNGLDQLEFADDSSLKELKAKTKELLAVWTEIELLRNSLVPDEKGIYILTRYIKERIDIYSTILYHWESIYKTLSKKQIRFYKKEYKFFPPKVQKMKKDLNNIQALCEILTRPPVKSVDDLQKQYDNLQIFINQVDLLLNKNAKEISKADYCDLINYKLASYDLIDMVKKTEASIVQEFYTTNKIANNNALEKSLLKRCKDIDNYLTRVTITTPKNDLGLTEGQIQEKMDAYFKAYDGINIKITIDKKSYVISVESPYFINNGNSNADLVNSGDDVGTKSQLSLLRIGKGDPLTLQKWLQKEVNDDSKLKTKLSKAKGKTIEDKLASATLILNKYMKDNKVGIDCSGFVSQFFNFISDKEEDMIYDEKDKFNPENMGSTDLSTVRYGKTETVDKKRVHKDKNDVPNGNQTFKQIAPENVQVGDTLYYHNKKGTDHIRIVRDVQKVNDVIYYTIYESAGSTGPREMRWKYENKKLYQYTLKKDKKNKDKEKGEWDEKKHEHFSRWSTLEIPGGSGAGSLAIPTLPTETKPKNDTKSETITFTFRTSYLEKNNQKSAYSLITKVLEVPWSTVIKLNGEKKVKVIKDKESIKLPKTAKLENLKK